LEHDLAHQHRPRISVDPRQVSRESWRAST
jgi:hypothetical protein